MVICRPKAAWCGPIPARAWPSSSRKAIATIAPTCSRFSTSSTAPPRCTTRSTSPSWPRNNRSARRTRFMPNQHPMLTNLARHAGRIAITVVVGGLLGATLVRVAPGFGIDEAELDSRLSAQSIQALRKAQPGQSLGAFFFQSLARLPRGDLGTSRSLQRPVAELLKERAAETAKSVVLGLMLGWTLGLSLAIAVVMTRSWGLDLSATLTTGLLLCLPAAVLALIFLLARMPGRLVLALIVFP